MTNWEYYFGTPERAVLTEVEFHAWPFMIIVSRAERMGDVARRRLVACHDSHEEHLAWLKAERDDGTIEWEEDA